MSFASINNFGGSGCSFTSFSAPKNANLITVSSYGGNGYNNTKSMMFPTSYSTISSAYQMKFNKPMGTSKGQTTILKAYPVLTYSL